MNLPMAVTLKRRVLTLKVIEDGNGVLGMLPDVLLPWPCVATLSAQLIASAPGLWKSGSRGEGTELEVTELKSCGQ